MKKSTYSGNSNSCVYVGRSANGQYVHVSVDPDPSAIRLAFTRDEWVAFLVGVLEGQFRWDRIPVDGAPHGYVQTSETVQRSVRETLDAVRQAREAS